MHNVRSVRVPLLPMTVAAGLMLAPLLALGQGAVAPAVAPVVAPAAAAAVAGAVMTAGPVLAARPRMSQLLGTHVYNERNENIGEIEDVILVPPTSPATLPLQGPAVILQIGGFLGLGGHLVAVPLADLRWDAEHSRIFMPGATKEALLARTAFSFSVLQRG